MDIRRLTYFLAVVDHGGFTAAADEVDVSQPALSLAVKELERELGVALLDRVGRRVQLTAAGGALVGPARQALRDVETGRAAVAAVAGVRAGTLSLASLPTLTADPLAELVGRYRRRYPGVDVDLAAPEDTSDLVAMVRDGRCEAGVTEAAEAPSGLARRAIGAQALLLILPPRTRRMGQPHRRALGGRRDHPPHRSPSGPPPPLADSPHPSWPPRRGPPPAGCSTRGSPGRGLSPGGRGHRPARRHRPWWWRERAPPSSPTLAVVARALGASGPPAPAWSEIALVHRPAPLAPAAARFVELARGRGPGVPGSRGTRRSAPTEDERQEHPEGARTARASTFTSTSCARTRTRPPCGSARCGTVRPGHPLAVLQPRGGQPGRGQEAPVGAGLSYGWSMMRIGAQLRRQDSDFLDRWYAAAGRALHEEGRKPHRPEVAEPLLAEIGLDPGHGGPGHRRPHHRRRDPGRARAGRVQGGLRRPHPDLRRRSGAVRRGAGRPPHGEAAVRLWRGVTAWLEFPHLYELQRPKTAEDIDAIATAFSAYLDARDWFSSSTARPEVTAPRRVGRNGADGAVARFPSLSRTAETVSDEVSENCGVADPSGPRQAVRIMFGDGGRQVSRSATAITRTPGTTARRASRRRPARRR